MTADEMFEELGYRKAENPLNYIFFGKKEGNTKHKKCEELGWLKGKEGE